MARQVLDCGDGAPAESPLCMAARLVSPECGGLVRDQSQSGDFARSLPFCQFTLRANFNAIPERRCVPQDWGQCKQIEVARRTTGIPV